MGINGGGIQQIIDDWIQEEQLLRKDRPRSGKWSPSSLGYCYRRQYWNRKNEEATNLPDTRSLRVMRVGDIFHKFIQGKIVEKNPQVQVEVRIETNDTLGFADIVMDKEVCDIKTQHSKKFWWNVQEMKKGRKIEDMFFNNWMQVMWYAWQLGKERARLIFISKDDLCIQEYSLLMDKVWEERLINEFNRLNAYWNDNQLPPPQPRCYFNEKDKTFKECSYCQFLDKCKPPTTNTINKEETKNGS